MGQAVGGIFGTVIVIAIVIGLVLVMREVWCWLLKLTAIHDELQAISAYLKAINEREAKREQRPIAGPHHGER